MYVNFINFLVVRGFCWEYGRIYNYRGEKIKKYANASEKIFYIC